MAKDTGPEKGHNEKMKDTGPAPGFVRLQAPETACSYSLDGEAIPIPKSRIVDVPWKHAELLTAHHGFTKV